MKKKVLFILMIFFCSILSINAAECSVSCPENILAGEEVQCVIEYKGLDKVMAIQTYYEISNNLSYVETKFASNWDILTENNKGFYISSDEENSSFKANVNFMVSSTANPEQDLYFKVKNIKVTDGNKETTLGEASSKINILKVEEIAKKIAINDVEYPIEKGVTVYSFGIKNKKEITVKLKDFINGAYIEGGKDSITFKDLKIGNNDLSFDIMYKDKKITTLMLKVNVTEDKPIIKDEEEKIENPKTFISSIFPVILGILVICIILKVYKFRKNKIGKGV